MTIIKPIFSYEHLAQLPDDGKRYELVEGELVVSPAPSSAHQEVVENLVAFLRQARLAGYGRGYVAPLDVVFDPHNVVQPDLFFIRQERLAIVTRANVQGAPDLIVEVLSPGTRARDLGAKPRLYARFRVPFYWVVDPGTRTVQPYTLREEGYVAEPVLRAGQTLTCPLFPGLGIDVAELFT